MVAQAAAVDGLLPPSRRSALGQIAVTAITGDDAFAVSLPTALRLPAPPAGARPDPQQSQPLMERKAGEES
jgi:hypothetical protein